MDLKKTNVLLLSGFYVVAGVNHFVNPNFYYPLIPDYLPFHEVIIYLSGLVEILLGIGVLIEKTRKISAYLLVGLLIIFISAHVHFLEIESCVEDGLCVPEWISWVRLLVIHPLLIAWVLSVQNFRKNRPLK